MKTIYKYRIDKSANELFMPIGAEVLCVQAQNNIPMLWAIVDEPSQTETRTFRLIGTGHPIPDVIAERLSYIGTIQLDGGTYVLHVFEESPI